MLNTITNLCIRCGKQRIDIKSYQEMVGNSVVVYTEAVCPDSDCQSKVLEILAKEKEKRMQISAYPPNRRFQKRKA